MDINSAMVISRNGRDQSSSSALSRIAWRVRSDFLGTGGEPADRLTRPCFSFKLDMVSPSNDTLSELQWSFWSKAH